jgi:hypothetical protein
MFKNKIREKKTFTQNDKKIAIEKLRKFYFLKREFINFLLEGEIEKKNNFNKRARKSKE